METDNEKKKINAPLKGAPRRASAAEADREGLGQEGNAPLLRFPGFEGEWEECRVSDFLSFYSTNSLCWEQLEYGLDNIKDLHYGLIHVGLPTLVDLSKETLPSIKDNIPISFELCKEGDVAFADASEDTNEVCKAVEFYKLCNQRVVCGLHTIHGRDNTGRTVVGFKGYAFSSSAFHNQIRRIAQGTKIYSISVKNFSECHIGIPPKAEQRKIADFLSLLDERIAAQRALIGEMERLIKGLNDTLYSRYHTEEETSFSKIGISYCGLQGKSAEDFGFGKPYISYLKVHNNRILDDSECELVNIRNGERQNSVRHGDVLFTLSSEIPEEVGLGAVYMGAKEVYLNSFCFGIHFINPIVFPPYMAFFISTSYFRKFIFPFAQGSTRYNLQKADFEKATLHLPNVKHQKKIYAIMKSITHKLELEKRILEVYLLQKQYLLRKMFI